MDVCVELPRFKLTVIQVQPLSVVERKPGTRRARAQTAGGAAADDSSAVVKDAGHKDLAYVLHTSGTTGPPKTVRVPHKCILPNILHLRSVRILLLCWF